MIHKFYLYSETGEISLKHHYPNQDISAEELIKHLKPLNLELIDLEDPDEVEFHTAEKFCITINTELLLDFSLGLIKLTAEKISNNNWANDDDYFDNGPSFIQELYLILRQWPMDGNEPINPDAYTFLLSFYKSLGLLYDSEEACTPNFKFSGFYNEI